MNISENGLKILKSISDMPLYDEVQVSMKYIEELNISEAEVLYSLKELEKLGLIKYKNQSKSAKKLGICKLELTNEGREYIEDIS